MPTKIKRAEKLLKGMGASAEDVAAFLLTKGVKGAPDDPDEDPVCRYLKGELGTADVCIEFGEVYVDSKGRWHPAANLPKAVDDFLVAFDAGLYPELIDTAGPDDGQRGCYRPIGDERHPSTCAGWTQYRDAIPVRTEDEERTARCRWESHRKYARRGCPATDPRHA